jgi:mannosyltransferase
MMMLNYSTNLYIDRINLFFKRTKAVLVIIVIIGAILRLYNITYQSLWYDELHSIIPTDPSNTLASVVRYCKSDQPPVFFVILFCAFKIFGYSELLGRLVAAFIGIISIFIMYLLGKECKSKAVGLFAALLTSLNYFDIYYSQELRFYSLAFALSATSFLFFIRAFKTERILDFSFYVLFTTLLLYTHYYGLIIYAVQAITFLILLTYKNNTRFIVGSIFSAFLIIALYSPWIPVILSDLEITEFWIKKPSPIFMLEYFYDYFGKDALSVGIFAYLIFRFLKKFAKNSWLFDREKPIYIIVLCWLFLSYFLPYVKSLMGTPLLLPRYTIVTLPALIIIIACGWIEIEGIKWRKLIALVAFLSMTLNLFFIRKYYSKITKQQLREASAVVKENNVNNDAIYSTIPWHYNYYMKGKVKDLSSFEQSKPDAFWLLTAELFSENERTVLLAKFESDFYTEKEYKFYKAEAFFLKRRTSK